ncbi:peptidase S8/S53 domain-containing protein [Cladochytrium replicatum]|nr:peptidase S8/S53 domain-containing protein [Cladochytrium replicatum]
MDDHEGDMSSSHRLTGVFKVRDQLGLTGKGVKVGFVDSGVDWRHPALGGCTSFPCARVAYGYDFVGDDGDAGISDPDPLDKCGGHGTHVAGIIGANSTSGKIFTGVAPDVVFGAYRIFPCRGASYYSQYMEAIQRAYDDGMDIVNMSLAGNSGFPDGPAEELVSKLISTGKIVFAISAGNAGAEGIWQVGGPAVSRRAISVAATTLVDATRTREITVGGNRYSIILYDDTPVFSSLNNTEIVLNLMAAPPVGPPAGADGCPDTPDAPGLHVGARGKILLVRRGTCPFDDKLKAANAAGATAIIVYNHGISALPVLGNRLVDPALNVSIPLYVMQAEEGAALASFLLQSGGNSTIAFDTEDSTSVSVPVRITDFSSWGLGPDLDFKPEIAAPGAKILSTYPLDLGGFAILQGTSMSAPYLAGVLALYKQYSNQLKKYSFSRREHFKRQTGNDLLAELFKDDPEHLKGRIMNAGKSLVAISNNAEIPDSNVHQGAGIIQADRLFLVRLASSPSRFALANFNAPETHILALKNYDEVPVRVILSHSGSSSVRITTNAYAYTNTTGSSNFGSGTSESFPIQILSGATANITVTFVPDVEALSQAKSNHDVFLVSGYIKALYDDGSNEINVPYTGLVGDRSDLLPFETIPVGSPNSPPSPAWVIDGQSYTDNITVNLASTSGLSAAVRTVVSGNLEGLLLDSRNIVLGTIAEFTGTDIGRSANSAAPFYILFGTWNGAYVDARTGSASIVGRNETYHVKFRFYFSRASDESAKVYAKQELLLPAVTFV